MILNASGTERSAKRKSRQFMEDLLGQTMMFVPSARETTERYHTGRSMLWLTLLKFSLEAVTKLEMETGGECRQ